MSARAIFYAQSRAARLGELGTLACTTSRERFQWLLLEVFDIRHPRVGDAKHGLVRHSFDSLKEGTARRRMNARRYGYGTDYTLGGAK